MKYNIIGYLMKEGFANILKNKKSTISCLVIMCATMLIFGIFFVIGQNIDHIIKDIEAGQGIEVFIKDEANEEDIRKLGNEIKAISGVNTIQYKSKEDALNHMKERFKDKQHLLDGLKIFPASYVVTLTDLTLSSNVQEQILELNNVKKITSNNDTMNRLVRIGNGIRVATIVILVLLVLISIFIISNTIKLTVYSRRKEISIMKYVGATNSFIRWPFLVEGVIIGIMSGILSTLIIGFSYNFIADKIMQSNLMSSINLNLLEFNDMFNLIIIVYLILGIGVGALGSAFSMKKYLDV